MFRLQSRFGGSRTTFATFPRTQKMFWLIGITLIAADVHQCANQLGEPKSPVSVLCAASQAGASAVVQDACRAGTLTGGSLEEIAAALHRCESNQPSARLHAHGEFGFGHPINACSLVHGEQWNVVLSQEVLTVCALL